MNCPNCGTPNNDSNINCVNCGAPLTPVQNLQYTYAQPQHTPGVANGPIPTVLYIIAGVMAALQVLMFFLPHLTSTVSSDVFMPVQLLGGASALDKVGAKEASDIVGGFMFFFIVVVALEIVWAIMSFMKKRPAGVFGVVACGVGFFIHWIWLGAMGVASSVPGVSMTVFPIFMLMISIAGIPVSIVQIVKKKYIP